MTTRMKTKRTTWAKTVVALALLGACGGGAGAKGAGGAGGGGAGGGGGDAAPAVPVPAGVWLSALPKHAGNFWNGVQPGDVSTVGYPLPELEDIDGYFEAKGIELQALGLVWPSAPVVTCTGLACARGDILVVIAAAADADRLVTELGFTRLPERAFFTRPALQCESAWGQGGAPAEEAGRLVAWAGEAGGAPAHAGFLFPTEATSRAQVCGSPRGDWAVVVPRDVAGASALGAAGFTASP